MTSDTTSYVEALAAWLPHCRWFSAKNLRDIDMQLQSIDCIDLHQRTDDGRKIQLACIQVETGIAKRNFLVPVQFISSQNSMLTCRDASSDATVSKWLLDLVQTGRTLHTRAGTFVGHSLQQQAG